MINSLNRVNDCASKDIQTKGYMTNKLYSLIAVFKIVNLIIFLFLLLAIDDKVNLHVT